MGIYIYIYIYIHFVFLFFSVNDSVASRPFWDQEKTEYNVVKIIS